MNPHNYIVLILIRKFDYKYNEFKLKCPFFHNFFVKMTPLKLNEKQIQEKIFNIRGKQVMFDFDLAEIYQVETRVLNQAVKRNIKRFPKEFMFQVTKGEFEFLKSQFVISKNKQGGRRKLYGVSINRFGEKSFGFSKFDIEAIQFLSKL